MKSWSTGIVVSWLLQLIVAGILLQTLFFKFTGAPESVYIFSTLGADPWGRIGSGIVELIASVLLLIPAIGFSYRNSFHIDTTRINIATDFNGQWRLTAQYFFQGNFN